MVKPTSDEPFFKEPRKFPKRGPGGFPIGKQTVRRQKENRELNKLPPSVKNVCELKIPGVCAGNVMLTWAHSQKTRFLTSSRDWQEAARACLPCHQFTEAEGHAKMRKRITEAISKRKL
jgi:hypothetical protein